MHWFWDESGNTGKTKLAQQMWKGGAAYFDQTSKKDVACALLGNIPTNDTYVFNITRTHKEYFNYGTLESIKDSLFFSPKYASMTVAIPTPNIVMVFANFAPDQSKMSVDRWDVTHIDANHDLIAPPAIKIVNKPVKAKFVVSAAPPGPSRCLKLGSLTPRNQRSPTLRGKKGRRPNT